MEPGSRRTRVTPVIQPDPTEVRRREQTGLGAVLDFDLTDRLAELPVDWPVPRDDLDPATQRLYDPGPRHWRLLELTYLVWRERAYASNAVQLFK
jgi:hypothetical protein